MKKFMAIYMASAATIAEMMKATPEQMKAGMAEWTKWSDANDNAIVDIGAPLGRTKRVSASGTSDSKNDLTGYTVVEAESVEDAAKLFKDHPHLKMGAGTTIDLLEVMPMEGM